MTGKSCDFSAGDKVTVSGSPGTVIGKVLRAASPDEMPELGPGSFSKEVKDVMHEMRVDLMLLIGHRHNDKSVCFWAVHTPGGWSDLHGQRLRVFLAQRGGA
jgi:hypothetical protein